MACAVAAAPELVLLLKLYTLLGACLPCTCVRPSTVCVLSEFAAGCAVVGADGAYVPMHDVA